MLRTVDLEFDRWRYYQRLAQLVIGRIIVLGPAGGPPSVQRRRARLLGILSYVRRLQRVFSPPQDSGMDAA